MAGNVQVSAAVSVCIVHINDVSQESHNRDILPSAIVIHQPQYWHIWCIYCQIQGHLVCYCCNYRSFFLADILHSPPANILMPSLHSNLPNKLTTKLPSLYAHAHQLHSTHIRSLISVQCLSTTYTCIVHAQHTNTTYTAYVSPICLQYCLACDSYGTTVIRQRMVHPCTHYTTETYTLTYTILRLY